MFLLKAVLLASLVKLLLNTNKPALCAGIYVALSFLLGLMVGRPFAIVLIAALISFLFAFAYFWLLDRFEDSGVFWVILIAGLILGFV